MERQVIFYDGMDNDPADYNNLQKFVQHSIDHVVADAVTDGKKYAGFLTQITGAASVEVAIGRLYSGGQVFDRAEPLAKSFLTQLPAVTKKIALLVVYGQEEETDSRPREFLINEETGASQPQSVAMERTRICNINFAMGQEAPDPIDPVVDAGVVPIARIVLTPAGVSTVTMLTANQLDSVSSVAGRAAILEDFQRRTEPQVVALGSDIATLKVAVAGTINKELFGRTLGRLAAIEEKTGIPSAALDSDCDFFLDTAESDSTFAGYDAKVAEGIRFAAAASATSSLAVFDVQNPRAKIVSGVMFPAYSLESRLVVGPRQGEAQVSAYTYQGNEMQQLTMSRTRIRYGEEQTVCTNSAWWQSGQYDPAAGILKKDGETFAVSLVAEFGDVPGHNLNRVQTFWEDTYEEPYWAQITVDHTVAGAQIAETFLNANGGLLAAVDLTFTRLAETGGITLAICETQRGMPDLQRVISVTTVDRAALKLNDTTTIPIQPVYLQGGRRYAIVVITASNHWVATTQGSNFPQGTFFYVLDGAYQQGDGTRDLCFGLRFAKFEQSRAVIEMQPLQLAGGMTSIDILADSIVPGSTDLTYEIQVGSVWYPLAATDVSALATLPALVPLRAVFTGTPDAMPAVRLTGSRVIVSRPKSALTWVSQVRTLPAASASIRVMARLEHFDAAHNTAVGKIRTGAGHNTVVNASSVIDVLTDDGAIERTWIFNLGAGVTSFRKQFEATSDSVHRPFHFGWAKDFAL